MKILVINSGSSSIKYQLFDMDQRQVMASGIVERIGEEGSRIKHNSKQRDTIVHEADVADHRQGLALMVDELLDENTGVIGSADEITAIGHRVVHGGEEFSQPTLISDEVKAAIKRLIPLAPLHNPANLTGIEVAQELFPAAKQVAVFDTAFHQTLPEAAYRYAIPNWLYEKHGIRVYGFHGTSHLYVSKVAARYLGKGAEETNLITAHLGNGASISAVRGGRSVETSMGFSPLAGLIMGTRSGDLDPVVPIFLADSQGMEPAQIDKLLNKQSGLLGLTGQNDLRDIEERQAQGDQQAQLALDMVAHRLKKYIGAYTAVLGQVDALVFTAGIGEHSDVVRRMACQGLQTLGIILDEEKNRAGANGPVTEIQASHSPVKVLIIPTNEELEIAIQTEELVNG